MFADVLYDFFTWFDMMIHGYAYGKFSVSSSTLTPTLNIPISAHRVISLWRFLFLARRPLEILHKRNDIFQNKMCNTAYFSLLLSHSCAVVVFTIWLTKFKFSGLIMRFWSTRFLFLTNHWMKSERKANYKRKSCWTLFCCLIVLMSGFSLILAICCAAQNHSISLCLVLRTRSFPEFDHFDK